LGTLLAYSIVTACERIVNKFELYPLNCILKFLYVFLQLGICYLLYLTLEVEVTLLIVVWSLVDDSTMGCWTGIRTQKCHTAVELYCITTSPCLPLILSLVCVSVESSEVLIFSCEQCFGSVLISIQIRILHFRSIRIRIGIRIQIRIQVFS